MSTYTTGEIAKLCDITVRTVQYYDSRGILVPSDFSEGGRRLYNDDDLKKLRTICFLRECDIPINTISELFEEENPDKVISILISQQKATLEAEVKERQQKLEALTELSKSIKELESFSVETIGDVAHVMKNKKELRKLRTKLLFMAIGLEIIEVGFLIYAIKSGVWLPFILGEALVLCLAIGIFFWYTSNVSYICPECHNIFKARYKEAFFASHTMRTRKLTCPCCNKKYFCVETYDENHGVKGE